MLLFNWEYTASVLYIALSFYFCNILVALETRVPNWSLCFVVLIIFQNWEFMVIRFLLRPSVDQSVDKSVYKSVNKPVLTVRGSKFSILE